MLNRDDMLELTDDLAGEVAALRKQLADETKEPTPIATATCAVELAKLAQRVKKLGKDCSGGKRKR